MKVSKRATILLAASMAAVVTAAVPKVIANAGTWDSPSPGPLDNRSVQLEFIGERELPNALSFQDTTVGGLSGLSYDGSHDLWYSISDDRSQHNPARFYTAALSFSGGQFTGVQLTGTHPWRRPDGTPYPPTTTTAGAPAVVAPDPEGIAVDPAGGHLFWTSEGERIVPSNGPAVLADPWVHESTTEGAYVGQLPLPPQLHVNAQDVGSRRNQTLEGLSFTPDGRSLVTAMEDPLYQDGADPTATHGALTRITTYDMGTGLPVAQYAYPLEPLFTAPPDGNVSDTNGVSDLVALDHDHLLVVERASIFKDNNWKIRIFLAERGDATDVLGRDSLAGPPIRTLRKRLLVDLSGVAGLPRVDNVEGITLGPRLPDGRRTLVLVSDDNFSAIQVTQFIAFAVRGL